MGCWRLFSCKKTWNEFKERDEELVKYIIELAKDGIVIPYCSEVEKKCNLFSKERS